jgi:hypothetical protein
VRETKQESQKEREKYLEENIKNDSSSLVVSGSYSFNFLWSGNPLITNL